MQRDYSVVLEYSLIKQTINMDIDLAQEHRLWLCSASQTRQLSELAHSSSSKACRKT